MSRSSLLLVIHSRCQTSFHHVSARSFSSCLGVSVPAKADVIVSGLQCEYLTDPLGIDVAEPRLTWKLSDTNHTRGQKQTAYQVLVASSPSRLEAGRTDIWDSGVVRSAESALVPVAGKALTSGEDCFWKVRVFDQDSKPSAWSSAAHFSIGLLKPSDWTGPWIKHPTAAEEQQIWFRKNFSLTDRPRRQ